MSTYGQLRVDIAEYLDRDDLTARIPIFVRLWEQEFDQDTALRLRMFEVRAQSFGQDDVRLRLPTDSLEVRAVRFMSAEPYTLKQVAPEQIARLRSGRPHHYAIERDELLFESAISDTDVIEINYFPRLITVTTDDANTNSVLQNAYGMYLYGSLIHSAPFLRETEADSLGGWQREYLKIRTMLGRTDKRARQNQGSGQVMAAYPTP